MPEVDLFRLLRVLCCLSVLDRLSACKTHLGESIVGSCLRTQHRLLATSHQARHWALLRFWRRHCLTCWRKYWSELWILLHLWLFALYLSCRATKTCSAYSRSLSLHFELNSWWLSHSFALRCILCIVHSKEARDYECIGFFFFRYLSTVRFVVLIINHVSNLLQRLLILMRACQILWTYNVLQVQRLLVRPIRYLVLLVNSVRHASRKILVNHQFNWWRLILVILLLWFAVFKLIKQPLITLWRASCS